MPADPTKILERAAAARAEKQKHEQVWRDCYDLTFPARSHGLQSEIVSASDAQSRKAKIFDSTGPDAVRTGVSTTMGGLVPANALWFGLDVGKESDEERRWLEDMAKFIWENLHASNFDAETFDSLIDLWCAGWYVLYEDSPDEGGYYFECWPLGQCTVMASRTAATVDTVYREFELSAHQLVAEYGESNVSEGVRQRIAANKGNEPIRVLLAIEPREVYAVGAKLARNLPFASVHIECQSRHVLRESGYHEFPCMVPRWSRLPGSAYAMGPVSDALPTMRTLNEMVMWTLMGAETVLAPPMVAEDDGVLNPRNIRMGPRKIIVANSVDSLKPLITGAKIEAGMLQGEAMEAKIRRILMADQLPPADGPVKTAYEWSVRVQTLRQMMGPMFGRFQAEFLQPLIVRSFGLAWRANIESGFTLVGRPPASLLNRSFTVRYLSPLARAQKNEDVMAMDRFEQTVLSTAQLKQDAELLDVYDFEGAQRTRGELLGVPHKLIRDARAVARIREARAQAQQQAEQQAMAANGQAEMQAAMAQRMANAA